MCQTLRNHYSSLNRNLEKITQLPLPLKLGDPEITESSGIDHFKVNKKHKI